MISFVEKNGSPPQFKDYFSQFASEYSRYRPTYPPTQFEFVSSFVETRALAWDCATGNGQAALGLTPYFDNIFATDASERQIHHAQPHLHIQYVVSSAERSPFLAQSFDAIVVATAAHWFGFENFYKEVRCVLKPSGIIAVWCYGWIHIFPEINAIIDNFKTNVVGPYWTPERRYIDEEYKTIPFPFRELSAPSFSIERQWNLIDVIGYLNTWSSSRLYKDKKGEEPTEKIRKELVRMWGTAEEQRRNNESLRGPCL